MFSFRPKTAWTTIWAILSQTHLVTLTWTIIFALLLHTGARTDWVIRSGKSFCLTSPRSCHHIAPVTWPWVRILLRFWIAEVPTLSLKPFRHGRHFCKYFWANAFIFLFQRTI
jgi:hypothetical protein